MTLNESLRDWIQHNLPSKPDLQVLTLVTLGETDELDPPFLGIRETGSEAYKQDDVMLPGVSIVEITCELHTVPADAENDGTAPETERDYRRQLYDILGDRRAIDWMDGRNGWNVFDIRLAAPTTDVSEGRRISSWVLNIVSAPAH